MKKLISIAQFLGLVVACPLVARLELLFAWPVLLVSVFIILLLATQPVLNFKESVQNKQTDKSTVWLIVLVSVIGQISSIIEWAYLQDASITLDFISLIGITLMIVGIGFRFWAIRTLGKAFSATVQIKTDQQLITSGPYKWFRHPSYTGAWILLIGISLIFHSWLGLIIMGPVMLWVYCKRIAVEENALTKAFGSAYQEYIKRTWRMLPAW